jgi:hypothetical protein
LTASSAQPSLGARLWSALWRSGVLVPLAYFLFLLSRAPHLDPHDWDYDEGINLMKALLVERGYHMFTEIWSDQPPLLTVTLGGLFAVTGPDVAAARLLVMALAALLLWGFYLTVRAALLALPPLALPAVGHADRVTSEAEQSRHAANGDPHPVANGQATVIALIACGLLVLSEFYLRLSGAVMVGLPASALAMLALAALVAGQPRASVFPWWRLLLSALLMALALQTKLLAAIMAPALAVAIFTWGAGGRWWPADWRRRLGPVLAWAALLLAVYLAAGFVLGALHFDLLFGTHFGTLTRSLEDFIEGSTLFFPHLIEQHVAFLLLGAIGAVYAARRRAVTVLVPLAWIATGVAAFSVHRPLWYHHTIILSVPLTWLGAYGVAALWAGWQRAWTLRRQPQGMAYAALTAAAVGAIVLVFWFYPNPYPERLAWQMTTFRPLYVEPVAERLRADAAQTDRQDWIFTDHPFYAFQAGLAVPPEIAVLSRKSLETGIITQEMLAQVMRGYAPRFVLFERFTGGYSPEVMDEIHAHYNEEMEADTARYYLRHE